jgi:hypothetical protein
MAMTRWNDQEAAGGGMFLLGALAGALVGAGMALLMAPKTGAQVRRELNSGLNTMRDAAARRYRDLADRAAATRGREGSAAGASGFTPPGATGALGESVSSTPGTSGYQG